MSLLAAGLTNPCDADLVYLVGGENLEHEIADFPALDRRMIRLGDKVEIYKLSAGKPFPGE